MPHPTNRLPQTRRYPAPLFLMLFFLSGVSGLIYQVVWMRMLIRVFGISLYAISTVVAIFMGGLAIGSWAAGQTLKRRRVSLKMYAILEAGIAASAIAASIAMKYLPVFYASIASQWYGLNSGPAVVARAVLRSLFAAAALSVPTVLMGATLPTLGQYLTHDNENAGGNLAGLYGINTVGAVAGVLFTGFVSLALWGESASIAIGVAVNLIVAALAGWFHLRSQEGNGDAGPSSTATGSEALPYFFFFIGGLTGFCALSFEILWSRLLIFLVGSSVYAFSSVLSIYLLGIGVGSLVAKQWVDRFRNPVSALGIVQGVIGVTGLISLHLFWKLGCHFDGRQFLYSPLRSGSDLFVFFAVSILLIFPTTFFMGISFPLLGRLVASRQKNFAHSVGTLYAWNTVGGVIGCLATGFALVPEMGTQAAFCLVAFLSLLIGSAIILRKDGSAVKTWGLLASVALIFLVAMPVKRNIILDILERRLARYAGSVQILFHREDPAGLVTGVQIPQGSLLLINGVITSGNGIPGHVMAHLPLLLHADPKSAAVICFGVGNTFRAAVDDVRNVDAVELVAGVVSSFGDFYTEADRYLKSPEARIFIEDGRQHLLMTKSRYDVIIVDASPPIFSAGTVNLYTTDFLEICRRRLTPDGIMCLWVPTPCFEEDFWRIASGFAKVYPHLIVWKKSGMAGVLLMGSSSDLDAAYLKVGERLKTRKLGESSGWLTRKFLNDAVILRDQDVKHRAAKYEPVTDDRPLTEFPLVNFLRGKKFWSSNDFL